MIETKKFSDHAGVVDMRLSALRGSEYTAALNEAAKALLPLPVVRCKRANANRHVWIISTRKLNDLEHKVLETSYFMNKEAT